MNHCTYRKATARPSPMRHLYTSQLAEHYLKPNCTRHCQPATENTQRSESTGKH